MPGARVDVGPLAVLELHPETGPIGTLLTISGSGVDFTTVRNVVVAGVPAVHVSAESSSMRVLVMPGTQSGAVVVRTAGGTFSSVGIFVVRETEPPRMQQGEKVQPADAGALGSAVAISADGHTIVAASSAGAQGPGAWVFVRDGGVWHQDGARLVGAEMRGVTSETSVAINADGRTIALGAHRVDERRGAVWVFVRSAAGWQQQGPSLVGSGAVTTAAVPFSGQGWSVALSADGNTLLEGGPFDGQAKPGAAWVFTRTNGVWSQQGPKLAPSMGWYAGTAVALSADGNTAVVTGYNTAAGVGGAFVYSRAAGVWTERSAALSGTGNVGNSYQGVSVAVAADGRTIATGGPEDAARIGAAWLFENTDAGWVQPGPKLTASDSVGAASQGSGVALSAGGDMLAVGGPTDGTQGAVWLYSRNESGWAQRGPKLVGTGFLYEARQGSGVALSADSSTLVFSGPNDVSGSAFVGSLWVFTR